MALHIRQEQTEKLARELAKRTGETLTGAVHRALEERLARMRQHDTADEERLMMELSEITKRSAEAFRKAGITKTSRELIEELYDEDGLPR